MNFGVSTSYFKIEIDGIECSQVREVNGFDVYSNDSKRYKENAGKTYTTELSITRQFTDLDFFNWLNDNKYSDNVTKKTGRIVFVTPDGDEIVSFKLEGIFPLEWRGPSLRKGTSWGPDQATEYVVIAVEKILQQ